MKTKRRIQQEESREDARERHEEDIAFEYPWLTRCVKLFNIFAYISLGAAGIHLLATLLPYFYLAQLQTNQSIVSLALVGNVVLISVTGAISFITLRGFSDAARLWLATAARINSLTDDERPKKSRF